jgi:cobalamin biosynthesis Mg chelatase CobN
VAKHAEASGPLTLSQRRRDTARTLPTRIAGSPFSASNVLPRRPTQPAEIAQARVFERLLQAECAELRDLAHRVGTDDSEKAEELTQIHARLDEVDGLLRALQGRFPPAAPTGDR